MKELSIEEKAKLYDEALNRAKKWHNAPNSDKIPTYANRVIEEIFPELNGSEEERIRKTIIRFFKDNYPNETQMYEGSVTVGKAIDWLEKQGEKDYTLSKEDVQALNRISAILVEASEVKNWWKEYRLIEKDEMFKLTDFLKSIKGRIQPTQGESNPYSGVSFECDGHIWGMCARDNGVDILLDKQLFKHLDKVEPQVYETKDGEVITYSDSEGYKVIEPKFKVGDWVAINPELRFASPLCIKDIDNNNYRVETINGESGTPKIDYLDNHYHLWSIQDAKDGDVLAYGDNPEGQHVSIIMLFKSVRTFNSVFNHFHMFNHEFRIDNWCDCGKTAHPATKEQRKTLFAKMEKEGYEWDTEKKELIKL